ncbi:MAG TPA: carbohydrate kinase family protein [Roseiarcus sp.]|nr:carbohydrate kinase family protein [Roseiarcus sp.]
MKIVVIGYASLDFVVCLDAPALPDRTATILSRPRQWPRLGGSPAYVCAALVAAGAQDVMPASWVGDDDEGARYREELRRLGVAADGVSLRVGRTPVCLLAYQPDGGCVCLYDPGLATPIELDETQQDHIRAADALVVTVGPPAATRRALACARADAKLIWIVKADLRATPPDLAVALAARADIVVHSEGEAAFVAEALAAAGGHSGRVRIETRGARGVAIHTGATETLVAADPLDVEDATGAGDTWVGGFLAARLLRGADLGEAARAGQASVRAMLAARVEMKGQA